MSLILSPSCSSWDSASLAAHEAAANPHPGYLTPAEGNSAYEAIGAVAGHAALTTSHGISSFGASLVDDADASAARTTLGLGTAATTATTAYATSAQGSTADSAIQPGDDAADLGSGAATDGYVLTADGAGGAAWDAAAVTYAGAASEIYAATAKTTPVDADELGLVDSAAGWALKKLSWANLKTTLSGVFAVLAGKSGGQTLIGGTGVTDKLVLQGTSGNGTVTSTALQVNVGNNGNLAALTVANNGQLTIQGDAITDLPVYGSELLTSAGWTVNTGWTESPDDVFSHSSGTGTLTHSATITNGYKYQISWTITGRTAGSVTIAVGGQSLASQTATSSFGPTATDTSAFTITPTTDFNGTLSLVSLKRITAISTPSFVVKNSSGTVIYEERTIGSNVCQGVSAGRCITTGSYNVCQGAYAGYSITTGSSNVCQGVSAGYSITTGNYNVCQGDSAGRYITTGSNNVCQGDSAGFYITTGSNNVCQGASAGRSITTGSSNVCQGSGAGRSITTGSSNVCQGSGAGGRHADGSTALTDPEYSIYIGYAARGKDNADNNSVVIGGNTPIGLGANTTVIGTSATTLTRLFGNLGLGVDSPSASIHTIKTTEQLRLGYDSTNYVSATVSSAGNLTLDTTGGTIYTPDTIENTVAGAGIVLKSPDGTRYRITVANGGTLSIAAD